MCMRSRSPILFAVVIAWMVSYVPAALGEEQLEEVVVTAQKRQQNLQDVTIAISALTQDQLEMRGMEGFRDWSEYVPGITVAQGTDPSRRSGPEATIRGVSQVVRGQIWEVPAFGTTTFTIGQVPFANADPGMFDLARVEVLRGPQGTLQGLASMGGTVRFIPNEAQADKFAAEAVADVGTIDQGGNTSGFGMMMNVPLIQDVLAIRVAAKHDHNGGWIDMVHPSLGQTGLISINPADFTQALNPSNTTTNANVMDKTGGRVSVSYTPNERFSLKAFTNWQKTSYATTSIADLDAVSDKAELIGFSMQPLTEDFSVSSIEASYDLGFGSLQYVGGWYTGRNNEATDNTRQIPTLLSGAIPNVLQANPALPADPYPSATSFPFATRSEMIDNELRLQGQNKPVGIGGMTFDYIVGLYYETEARDGEFAVTAPNWNANKGPNTLPILTEGGNVLSSTGAGFFQNKAVYTNLTLNVTNKLSVAAGIRYFDVHFHSAECRTGDFYSGKASNGATVGDNVAGCLRPVNVGHIKESDSTPSASVSYKIDDNKMLYFTAAQGKRLPAGFANPTGLSSLPPECTALAKSLGLWGSLQNGTTSDSIWSYDLGLKSKWMDNRLLVNFGVYYLVWTNMQEAVSILTYNPLCSAQIPTNLGEAVSKGIEFESEFAASEHWHFNMTLSTTDEKFTKVPPGIGSSIGGVSLKPGDRLRMVAPMTAAVGAEFDFSLPPILESNRFTGFWRADYRYVGGRMDNFGDVRLLQANPGRSKFFADAYNLTDMRIGVKSDDLTISLYASNVFNQLAVYESDQNAFQLNLREGSINQPRTIGLAIKKSF
jgi:iron complex outermembrane receptor protein